MAYVLYKKQLNDIESTEREKSVYHSDVFAMIGTLFLFCFWPSFNAGVAAAGDARLRAIVNTYISIASSVLLTYICSSLFSKEKKFDMVHVQNATLAGGVGMLEYENSFLLLLNEFSLSSSLAVGTVADKIIRPAGAMVIGSIAGALSTAGFAFIKPAIQKVHAHDTCGVNNLHGMPGLLAGIFGIILAIFPTYSLYTENLLGTCYHGENRTYLAQIGYQALTLGVTIVVAVIGGAITGFILNLPVFSDEVPSSYFNDQQHWETPSDFHDDATPFLPASHVDPNA